MTVRKPCRHNAEEPFPEKRLLFICFHVDVLLLVNILYRGIRYTKRFKMRQCMDVDAVSKRLKRIEGQIRGILKMVEDDKPCEDILVQIGAAKSALHKTGQVILEGHLHHCVLDAVRDGKEEESLKKLTSAIEQFSRII